MTLLEITYYLIFSGILFLIIFKISQPIVKPIFVSTVITSESKYSPMPSFVRRPELPTHSVEKCHSCGNPKIPNAKFCAFCGTQHLQDEME